MNASFLVSRNLSESLVPFLLPFYLINVVHFLCLCFLFSDFHEFCMSHRATSDQGHQADKVKSYHCEFF